MDLAALTLLSLQITLLELLIIVFTDGVATTEAGTGETAKSLEETFLEIQELHKTIMTTPGDSWDKIRCLRHHEFAAFIHAKAAEELKMSEPKNSISVVRTGTYTNKNGNVK